MLTYRRRSDLRLLALVFALVAGLAIVLGAMLSEAQAQATPQYTFTKVADSVEDGFDPNSFGCAAINTPGDIAFKAGRLAPDGFNTIPGIYRANADGTLTTIAEDQKRFQTIGFNPSINDSGQVSFAARLDGGNKPDTEAIFRGDGKKLTTIASTADEFDFFGFDTSINNSGEVAFKAELDEAEMRVCSPVAAARRAGSRRTISTIDGSALRWRRFPPIDKQPRRHSLRGVDQLRLGHLRGEGRDFQTIAAPDPIVSVEKPVLNDGERWPSRGPSSTRRLRSSSSRS